MTNDKTVRFQGITWEVPDWAHWITQDCYGSIMIWESEPRQVHNVFKANCRWDLLCGVGAPALKVAID